MNFASMGFEQIRKTLPAKINRLNRENSSGLNEKFFFQILGNLLISTANILRYDKLVILCRKIERLRNIHGTQLARKCVLFTVCL